MANLGYIQLVRHCNQRCLICSNPETPNVLAASEAFSQIDDLVKRGYDGLILTGGEPSLSDIVADVVRYARSQHLAVRMITNGSRLGDRTLAREYIDAGLQHFHVSLYSCYPAVHDLIAQTPGSHDRACDAIAALSELGAVVHVNTVIQKRNCDHLDAVAGMIVSRFARVRHVVFNNLDPLMGRAKSGGEQTHRLTDMQGSLFRALNLLHRAGRSFRVERVPLCFMTEFAWASTETRKIVKGEERIVHFLDQKGMVRQTRFVHEKAPVCSNCSVESICAGLYASGRGYEAGELAPLFVDKMAIIRQVHRT